MSNPDPQEIVLEDVDWGQWQITCQLATAPLSALMYAAETERTDKTTIINRALLLYAMVLDADHTQIVVIQEQPGNVWRRVMPLRDRPIRRNLFMRIWNAIRPRKDPK